MQKLYILFLFIAMYVSANSAEILSPYIQLSSNSVTFEAKAYNDYKYIELLSNTGWIASVDTNIFSFNPKFGSNSGTITISGRTNNWATLKVQTITIRDSAKILNPQIVKVYQKGSEEYIKVNRNSLTLTKLDKSSASISLIANTSWTFKNVPSWLTINRNIGNNNSYNIELTLEFIASKLPDSNPRTANIEIVGQFGASQTVTITQVNEEPFVKFHTGYMKIPAKLPDGYLHLGIKSNTYWNVSSDGKLSTSYFDGRGVYNNTVSIQMLFPNGPFPRSATFTATANGAPTQYLVVEQEASEPYLKLSVDTLFFTKIPNSSNTISILSNTSWTMTNMPSWLHYKKGNIYNNDYGFYLDNGTNIDEGKIDFITNTALTKTLIVKKLDELPKIQTSVSSVTVSSKRYSNQDYQLKISANNSFNIRNSSDWAFASRSSYNQNIYYLSNKDTIILRINENYSSSPRSATISGEKDGVLYPFLEIYQEGNPAYINFSSTIALEKEANSSKVFGISSNSSWTITNLPNWVKVNKTSDYNGIGGRDYSLTFTTENKLNTQFRTGTFEILSESLPSKTITVVQLAEEPYLQISTNSMTISDKPDILYSIDIKSNTNWFIGIDKNLVKSDYLPINSYFSMIGFGNTSITFTTYRNLDSINRVAKINFMYLIKDSTIDTAVEITQLKTSEFIDLEVLEISAPFDLIDTTELLNKRYNCSVKFKNNSTVPIEHIPISLDIVDCFTGRVDLVLDAMLTFIDTGSSNTEIVKFGNFSLIRAGNYYARATVRNLNDKTFSNNTLKSKCKYFDNPEVTKVEDVPIGDFRIHPNPNNGYFNISGYEAIDYLRIVDLLGNTIYEQEKPTNSIVLNNINAGVYWVLVTSNGISKMEKLVIY